MAEETKVTSRTRGRWTAEARRGQILAAAITLFTRRGFARTTTKEIAAEAGVAEGTIYKYFASKQDLLFSFLEAQAIQPLQHLLSVQEGGASRKWCGSSFSGGCCWRSATGP